MNRKFQFVIYAPLNEFNRNAIAWPTSLIYILKSSVKKHRHSLARSFIIIFVHSCKKHGLECFFVENICFSKGLRPIHIGANRISCFDNMNNFTLIGV
jgi:hypothetical protein